LVRQSRTITRFQALTFYKIPPEGASIPDKTVGRKREGAKNIFGNRCTPKVNLHSHCDQQGAVMLHKVTTARSFPKMPAR